MTFEGDTLEDLQEEVLEQPPPAVPPIRINNPHVHPQEPQQMPTLINIVENPYKKQRKGVNAFQELMAGARAVADERQKKKRKQNTEQETPTHSTIAQRSAQAQRRSWHQI